ncbi:MAG: lactonase family protein [Parvibaculaceae bacterium]
MPADDTHVLVTGRWDPWLAVVDIAAALDPFAHDRDRAVVGRARVTPDVAAGNGARVPGCGLPVSLAVSQRRRRVFVVNHAGAARPEATQAMPHGHPGAVAVMDLDALLEAKPDSALLALIPTETAGPVGCALTGNEDLLLVTSGEGRGSEDGGHLITVLDVETGRIVAQTPLRTDAATPAAHPSPHADFGRFPNPNGIAVTSAHGGLAFTANGGTDSVSILRLSDVTDGRRDSEIARIAVDTGPFGLAASPDGALLAVANRESMRSGREGNTVSLIDVASAIAAPERPRTVSVRVGADRSDQPSRPVAVAFSADGRFVFATCLRTGTLSRIDVATALAGGDGEDRRIALRSADGNASCPRGVHLSSSGNYLFVCGGARGESGSSTLWILDPESLRELARIRGVGNESYLLTSIRRSR